MRARAAGPALWIALAFVLLNLPGLDRSPVVWIDEVTLNDPARELARHGVLRSSVFAGQAGFEESYFWQPPGQAIVTALVYRVFGFGIWQTRLPPLLFAAACLVALYAVADELLDDRRAAALAAALFALDPKLLQVARSGRMDPQCLLLALLAALVCLRALAGGAREPEGGGFCRRLALSGLLVGLAGVTHPLAVAWALALGLLVVVQGGRGRRLSGLACFALPAALPAALWLLYVLRSSTLQVFAAQFLTHGAGHLARGSLWGRLAAEIGEYRGQYALAPLLPLTYLAGFAWLLWKSPYPRRAKQAIAILFLTLFLFDALVMTKGLGFYFLHPAAVLAIPAGAWIAALPPLARAAHAPRAALAWAGALLLAANLLAAGLVGRWLSLAFQWRERGYGQVASAVAAAIPAGSLVWGPPEVWYAVEEAGATLRLVGPPDPRRHDFLVLRRDSPIRQDGRLVKVAELGAPLPPVFGIRRDSADYVLEIWTWRRGDPRALPLPARSR